ncbi:RrF2 family transcriptional regulator [Streptomyces dysideae]|uniref:Rrf2 family transcriptional regulator n=1 Tax=Streptomyces dysideae TaxID=909626 RepID=A0A101V1F0_9ACTN|nr:Rrf2 family transcriptional regulator [Streptomyces dysideae]KUO20698.1 Rrf2 family transcriptional regulator [Streptomyces dysideae]
MRITAKTDYAVRAMAELAGMGDDCLTADHIAARQDIPVRFLFGIFRELRLAGLVVSVRGPEGGYRLARSAREITLADVIRAVDGSLANVRDLELSTMSYPGPAASLPDVWRALRTSLRRVLEATTLADLASGSLPESVGLMAREYLDNPRGARGR